MTFFRAEWPTYAANETSSVIFADGAFDSGSTRVFRGLLYWLDDYSVQPYFSEDFGIFFLLVGVFVHLQFRMEDQKEEEVQLTKRRGRPKKKAEAEDSEINLKGDRSTTSSSQIDPSEGNGEPQRKRQKVEREVIDLEAKLKGKEEEKKEKEEEIKRYQETIKREEEKIEREEEKIEREEEKKERGEKELSTLRKSIDKLNAEIRMLNETTKDEQSIENKKQISQDISSMKQEISSKEQLISSKEQLISSKEQLISSKEQLISSMKQLISSMNQRINMISTDIKTIDDHIEKITIEIKNKKFDTPEKFYHFLEQNFTKDIILYPKPAADNFSKQNLGYTDELDQTFERIRNDLKKANDCEEGDAKMGGRRLLVGIDAASGTGKTHFLDQLLLKCKQEGIYVIRISFNNRSSISESEIQNNANYLVNRLVFELLWSAKKTTDAFDTFCQFQTFGDLTFSQAVKTLKKYFQFSLGVILIDEIAKVLENTPNDFPNQLEYEKVCRENQRTVIASVKSAMDCSGMVGVFTTFQPQLLAENNREKLGETNSSRPLMWVDLPQITNFLPRVIFEKSSFFGEHTFEEFQEFLKIENHESYLTTVCAFVSGHARSYEALALKIGNLLSEPSQLFKIGTLFSAISGCYKDYRYNELMDYITKKMLTVLMALDLSRTQLRFNKLVKVNWLTDLDENEPLPWVKMITNALLLNSINNKMQYTVLNLAQIYFILKNKEKMVMRTATWFSSLADLTNIKIMGNVPEDWGLYERFHLKYESLRWNIFYELLTLNSNTAAVKDETKAVGKYKFTAVEVDGHYQWSIPIKEWFFTGLESKQCSFEDNDVLLFTSPLHHYDATKLELEGKKELFSIMKNRLMNCLLCPNNWSGFDSGISFIRYNTATEEKRPLYVLFENKSGTNFRKVEAQEKLNKIILQYRIATDNDRKTDWLKDIMVMFVAFKCVSNVLPDDCSQFGGVGVLKRQDLEYYGSFSRYFEVVFNYHTSKKISDPF